MRRIFQELDLDFDKVEEPFAHLSPEVIHDYEKSIEAFDSICVNINEVSEDVLSI